MINIWFKMSRDLKQFVWTALQPLQHEVELFRIDDFKKNSLCWRLNCRQAFKSSAAKSEH